jgi:hypothetical protein
MELTKELKDDIWEYCRLNDITDLNAFMVRMLRQGYNIEKYGATPFKMSKGKHEIIEKEIIKEVPVEVIREVEKIIEIIKEVPVEVIKEVIIEKPISGGKKEVIVEKRVEVPVEVIKEVIIEKEVIREVPVEVIKEIHIKDDEQIKKLEQKIDILKAELEIEKNRNYQPKRKEQPKEEKSKNSLNSVISWVPKSEREEDLYNE